MAIQPSNSETAFSTETDEHHLALEVSGSELSFFRRVLSAMDASDEETIHSISIEIVSTRPLFSEDIFADSTDAEQQEASETTDEPAAPSRPADAPETDTRWGNIPAFAADSDAYIVLKMIVERDEWLTMAQIKRFTANRHGVADEDIPKVVRILHQKGLLDRRITDGDREFVPTCKGEDALTKATYLGASAPENSVDEAADEPDEEPELAAESDEPTKESVDIPDVPLTPETQKWYLAATLAVADDWLTCPAVVDRLGPETNVSASSLSAVAGHLHDTPILDRRKQAGDGGGIAYEYSLTDVGEAWLAAATDDGVNTVEWEN